MNKKQIEALDKIEGQLYAINARNISLRWIGFQHIPTMDEICLLNDLLGFLIHEIRTLKETGDLNTEREHDEFFKNNDKEKGITRVEVIDNDGRAYTNWDKKNQVELSLQDKGKTLKIFIKKP